MTLGFYKHSLLTKSSKRVTIAFHVAFKEYTETDMSYTTVLSEARFNINLMFHTKTECLKMCRKEYKIVKAIISSYFYYENHVFPLYQILRFV